MSTFDPEQRDTVVLVNAAGEEIDPSQPVLAAGENHLGEVGSAGDVIDVLPTLYAAGAIADGGVLFNPIAIPNAARVSGGRVGLQSLQVLDEDDLGLAFDLIFMDASSNLGTLGSAPNISDANARKIIGRVQVTAGDYYDIGGARFASVNGIGLLMKALAGRDIYVAGIARGAGTYTANGLRLKFGVGQD